MEKIDVFRSSTDYGEVQYSISKHRLERLLEDKLYTISDLSDAKIAVPIEKALSQANREFSGIYNGWVVTDFHSILLKELKLIEGSLLVYDIRFYAKKRSVPEDSTVLSIFILMDGKPMEFEKILDNGANEPADAPWPEAILLKPRKD